MAEDKTTFKIEGNPGQHNTFVNIGHVENNNPNATTVNNTYYGTREWNEKVKADSEQASGKKLGEMTIREMLAKDMIDTASIQTEITNYVSCIRKYVRVDLDKIYMKLWSRILYHEVFKVDLYDPGKQDCKYNRNLIANIIHYLDGKGFYKESYNSSEMTRAVEGDADNPVRKAFRNDPSQKYCDVVDAILKELK